VGAALDGSAKMLTLTLVVPSQKILKKHSWQRFLSDDLNGNDIPKQDA
jgi:hypothetical protein